MDRDYTITRVEPRESWDFQGQEMQNYAVTFQGEEGWIKLTQQLKTPPPQVNTTLHGVIETKTDNRGTDYRKFRKVNPKFSGRNSQEGYIVQMLEELTGRRPKYEPKQVDEIHSPTEAELEDPFQGII
jgi:hypothetical protein